VHDNGGSYRTSPDTACAAVPGGAVIIHLGTNRYFSLNATAAVVWSRLDAGEDVATIAAALARDFKIDDVTARDAVARTITQFEEAGLLLRAADM
jgi:Coenzyme PQQ synthesis protein D (PqqD)